MAFIKGVGRRNADISEKLAVSESGRTGSEYSYFISSVEKLKRKIKASLHERSNKLEKDLKLFLAWHEVSVFPKKESPVWSLLQTLSCLAVCTIALLVHHYPTSTFEAVHFVSCLSRLRKEYWRRYLSISFYGQRNRLGSSVGLLLD